MPKIKDIPKIDRPRERFLQKGADALSKSDLLAILLGSGIKGTNVRQLSENIIKKFGKNFLNITVDDLLKIPGIGQAKALQIASAISLVKRFYEDEKTNEGIIKNSQNVLLHTYELRDKKKEHLVCLYLNARNALLKKEIISVGLLDKALLHPREIFYPATELNAASIILVHNHPSGDSSPSGKDNQIVEKIVQAGEIMGIPVIDFIIVSVNGNYSFFEKLKGQNKNFDYVADGFLQGTLFNLLEIEKIPYEVTIKKILKPYFHFSKTKNNTFQLQNRRYLGNKHKLLGFIEDIVSEKCNGVKSFCDIFAGTGVVGERFNKPTIKVISNDILFSNYACLKAFLGISANVDNVAKKIKILNNLKATEDNYFSKHFGNTYFSLENSRKIGAIREEIENIAETEEEKNALICSLLYAVDKVANTVGHYDAFRKDLDMIQPVKLLTPDIDYSNNATNEIYKEDANILIRKISCDVLYIDPPYNSRQYSDAYHLLENLAEWKKPEVVGMAKKMDRSHIKSSYCLRNSWEVFIDFFEGIGIIIKRINFNQNYI